MSYDTFKRLIRKAPVSGAYLRRKELEHATGLQADEITGLREAVDRLEKRNDEWAAEVRLLRGDGAKQSIVWPVKPADIIAAKWYQERKPAKRHPSRPPFTINWVVPPMGRGSGGHTDIFRTIHYLENRGHTCRVYFYDASGQDNLENIRQNLKHYAPIKSQLFYNAKDMEECDAIFATNWFTAYPVFTYRGVAKKYYYVQDFEPYFDPVGTYSTLAENTYKFGLRGLTLGSWLSEKLSSEYGMHCDPFELGSDPKEYYFMGKRDRKNIVFYARPVTPRRGFELGILALQQFHKEHPEYELHFVGWDISRYEIPVPYVNHGIVSVAELNELYNRCAAGLVLSFTNMSLSPLEMLGSGCVPVMNDSKHTRMVSYGEHLSYAESSPQALADALYAAATKNDQTHAQRISEYAHGFKWDDSNAKIEQILLRELSTT